MPRLAALALGLILAAGVAHGCSDFATAPTSRWRLARRDGVAWLLTPCGEPFLSIGVNTLDGGRHGGYDWTRAASDFPAWLATTHERLTGWGFNTASGTALPPDVLRLPVIPNLALGSTARFHWVDPFDPATEERMRETARVLVRPYVGRPYRIGYFSDNEVGWWNGALFAFYLEQAPTNHTKRRLVALLRDHYGGDWRRFARDFVPPAGVISFDGLVRARRSPTLRPGGSGMRVVRAWTAVVADRYYRLAREAISAADPDALFFGDRLPIYYDPAAVRAMAPWVDAVATNYNVDSADGWIARYFFDGLRRLTGDKPVLVSEWFFAAEENRTGNRNNGHLMTVATQRERAAGAAAAAERFAREPSIVGAHWFQYYDHPRGGRADGEDYNFGLVDVDDRPYEQLVAALARTNAGLVAIHAGATRPAAAPNAIPRAAIDLADRSLADWPKDRALSGPFRAARDDVPFADVFVSWERDGLALAIVGMDYHAPELVPVGRELAHADAFQLAWGVDAGAGPRRFAVSFVPPPSPAGDGRYAMRADLCRTDGGRCAPVADGRAVYFGADQPRIAAEVRIPWASVGVAGPPARGVRLELAVTGFHHARWMSTSGLEPAEALRDPRRWRRLPLDGAS